MKKLMTLAIALLTVNAFAGSAQMKFTTGFSGDSEAAVVAAAEAAIPAIQTGDYKPLNRDMRFEGCWPMKERYIKVGSLSVSKIYKFENGTLNPVFLGRLSVTHKRCRDDR
ncbi:MAG: hypothetical protein GY909_17740 [Oligoflexia bacterium]|nr:hypothetical protein [Oligoflexia bacterium]